MFTNLSRGSSTLSTRERILTAAEEVMRTKGLARSTTKEIARASGFSEATLYKHFANQEELFLAVLGERLPGFIALLLKDLPARVGRAGSILQVSGHGGAADPCR